MTYTVSIKSKAGLGYVIRVCTEAAIWALVDAHYEVSCLIAGEAP